MNGRRGRAERASARSDWPLIRVNHLFVSPGGSVRPAPPGPPRGRPGFLPENNGGSVTSGVAPGAAEGRGGGRPLARVPLAVVRRRLSAPVRLRSKAPVSARLSGVCGSRSVRSRRARLSAAAARRGSAVPGIAAVSGAPEAGGCGRPRAAAPPARGLSAASALRQLPLRVAHSKHARAGSALQDPSLQPGLLPHCTAAGPGQNRSFPDAKLQSVIALCCSDRFFFMEDAHPPHSDGLN